MRVLPFAILLSPLGGCGVATLTITGADSGALGPELTPASSLVDFGSVAAGMGGTAQVLELRNTGDSTLQILGFSVDDPAAPFTIETLGASTLEPGESTAIVLGFSPSEPGSYGANLRIGSNDAAGVDEVVLVGESADGGLTLSPATYDFGTLTTGCVAEATVAVTNVGGSAVTVTSASLVGADPELTVTPASPLPWTLGAGQSADLTVAYAPTLQHVVFGTLTVTSTSTATPEVTGTYFGQAQGIQSGSDHFTTPDGVLDVVAYIDKSQSMQEAGYVDRFRSTMVTLYDTLQADRMDFQLAVVTDDDGCVNGPNRFITQATPRTQALSTLSAMLDSTSAAGELAEQGLSVLYAATEPDATGSLGCNPGLVRGTGDLALLGISDEDEQSGKDSGAWVSAFSALKPNTAAVRVNAIVGATPSGCEAAQAGELWAEVAQLTGGKAYSICNTGSGWSANLSDLVRTAAGLQSAYVLSSTPDVATLAVTVDGAPSTAWTYDSASRSIVFDDSAGLTWNQDIEVDYTIAQSCDR